ncbi:MAG TPA: AAA family ATPase [Gammaproteobacteria bacterium]|jgi:predicted AAA+ superfamily ATPase|nr:AAA family ATPase [Gammaproteobacteria bacterium]
MEIQQLNELLAAGIFDAAGQFPHLERLQKAPFQFKINFGLASLPEEAGILLIRGARQYGKSTWLETEIKKTIQQFGPGSAYYLNGEYIADIIQFEQALIKLLTAFEKSARVKRLFIDEITAIPHWELVLKRLADRGLLQNILVITTGSKATDLRRAHERLPGRRGKLSRSTYLFTPITYSEFHRVCGHLLGQNTLIAYLLSGGSPIACSELATEKVIPEYVIELTRDWIEGEVSAANRSRAALLNILQVLFRYGTTPVGQAKLARESGLSNNTVAAGYIELLNDLGCVIPAFPWDNNKKILLLRKECKYHFTNLLVAVSYHQNRIRSVNDFLALSPVNQAMWYEWLVAQELSRRAAITDAEILSPLAFWQSKENEIDFVVPPDLWIEVKRGRSSAIEFGWFPQVFPKQRLTVINSAPFETSTTQGITLENFLESE